MYVLVYLNCIWKTIFKYVFGVLELYLKPYSIYVWYPCLVLETIFMCVLILPITVPTHIDNTLYVSSWRRGTTNLGFRPFGELNPTLRRPKLNHLATIPPSLCCWHPLCRDVTVCARKYTPSLVIPMASYMTIQYHNMFPFKEIPVFTYQVVFCLFSSPRLHVMLSSCFIILIICVSIVLCFARNCMAEIPPMWR